MLQQSVTNNEAMWDAYNRFHYLCDTKRFQKLVSRVELIRMISDVPGDIVDAGAFKGISTIQFAHMLQIYQPNSRSKVISFDTFDASFPRLRPDEAVAAQALMNDFEESALDQLTEAVAGLDLNRRVKIVRGDIVETFPSYLAENPGFRICLLHCDLDVYEATLRTLEAAWPRIVPGGVIVFDEYAIENWGESDAVDEFLKSLKQPPKLKQLPSSITPTAYCVKGE